MALQLFYIQTTVQKSLPWIDGLLDASENILLKLENHYSVLT